MRLSHADFRPGKRPRYAPSGPPRRKVPLIRIVLLIGLGIFVYTRFDTMWSGVRDFVNPDKVWHKLTGQSDENRDGTLKLTWSSDSSRVSLECPRGLNAACCESLADADGDLCGEASALLEKAQWKRALQGKDLGKQPLFVEGRAVVSDLGDWGFELSDLRGRDAAGAFVYRRAAGSQAWCDTRRGCLKPLLPRAPLLDGRLSAMGDLKGSESTAGATSQWLSGSPRVRSVLPGRVVAVIAAQPHVFVRVYHGGERYVTYGPLKAAPGVKPGVMVKLGSHLGDAAMRPGTGGYSLTVRLRDGGRPSSAESFWGIRPEPALPDGPLPTDDPLYSAAP
jgi:hypothetical protein